ncbi:MAG: UDP-N-acetylmuramoyl-L-alanyl-D-glutamate--2,6-diaminopimelate ligase [Pseudonocardiaceae bacterium]|nr:UDP-N-acetylmuramoyl-L-alanyl-D-glutamate--2,6-diaminopimelate ligase [Pseudonocardiaceae bacterium]
MTPLPTPATPAPKPLRPTSTPPVALAELAELLGLPAPARAAVSGAALWAQQVQPGDLFAALPSLGAGRPHGADFAVDALAGGAAAVLTDPEGASRPALAAAAVPVLVHPDPRAALGPVSARIYGDPSDRLAVLGITGTSGKTTVTYLLEEGLRAAGAATGLLGTVETRIGTQRLPSAFTTPEAPDLQALLAVMAERGVTHLPMEVSSHALSLGRVGGTGFAVGAFSNLSQDHLDFHPGMADYFAAKALLFDGRAAREVVCIDDEWGRRLAAPGRITVSLHGPADWHAASIEAAPAGSQAFRVLGPDGFDHVMSIRLPGAFNVTNALLAMACGHAAGADPRLLLRGIGRAEVPGRMQRVDRGQDFLAVVDYAHKPAAVAALLDAVRGQVAGRVIVVLGCGGDRDTAKRPVMGAEAARRADLLIVTDDNPRSEDPAAIRAAMLCGARRYPNAQLREIGDRAEAIGAAVAAARAGDAVVVAGKGHETGQQVGGVTHPFSDAAVLADLLDEVRG